MKGVFLFGILHFLVGNDGVGWPEAVVRSPNSLTVADCMACSKIGAMSWHESPRNGMGAKPLDVWRMIVTSGKAEWDSRVPMGE